MEGSQRICLTDYMGMLRNTKPNASRVSESATSKKLLSLFGLILVSIDTCRRPLWRSWFQVQISLQGFSSVRCRDMAFTKPTIRPVVVSDRPIPAVSRFFTCIPGFPYSAFEKRGDSHMRARQLRMEVIMRNISVSGP